MIHAYFYYKKKQGEHTAFNINNVDFQTVF